jgi:response regulator of citrate/malate metabolism
MLRVLIVEDDYRVARVNQGFVASVEGFAVAGIAHTAAEAEQLVAELQPELIILDLYLPDGSGLDLLRRLRSGGQPADVIVVTAAKEGATVQEALRAGAVDYILKPYRLERFAGALRRYLEYRRQMAGAAEVEQEQVDRLLALRPAGPGTVPATAAAPGLLPAGASPKGIDPLTLEKVVQTLRGTDRALTAEEFGLLAGLSRTTARRYLEYLVGVGRCRVEAAYGSVGRPERLYAKV